MKILHVNSYYLAGKFYKEIYDRQVRDKLDITVYTPDFHDVEDPQELLGEYTLYSRCFKKNDRFFFRYKSKKIYNDLLSNLPVKTFDIIHAHSLFTNGYIAYQVFQEFQIPYIVAVRNADVNTFFKHRKTLTKIGKRILINAKEVIFLSEPYKEQTLKLFKKSKDYTNLLRKSIVIPNGLNDFWFKNRAQKDLTRKFDPLKVVSVGDINRNKNLLITANTLENLIKQGYNIQFKCAGKKKNNQIFDILSKKDYFFYQGILSKEQLIHLYRECDIFIMPSFKETFGLVYVEAMSQGLPIIYSKNQGFDKQFIDGFIGFSVNPHSSSDIEDAIKKILDNYQIMSNRANKSIDLFDWDDIVTKYQNIYYRVLSE